MARIPLTSPAGRIVQGSPSIPELYNWDNGVRTGLREKPQYFFALAIAKNDPLTQPMLDAFWQQAHAFYGACTHPNKASIIACINRWLTPNSGFSWKIEDGEIPNIKSGVSYPGAWLIKFSTLIPPAFCDVNNNPIDGSLIETGDYADVAFTIEGNGRYDRNAGLYVSQTHVRLLGKGVRITKQIAPSQAFGAPGRAMGDVAPSAPSAPPASAPTGHTAPQAHLSPTAPAGNAYAAPAAAPTTQAPGAIPYPSATGGYTAPTSAPTAPAAPQSPVTPPAPPMGTPSPAAMQSPTLPNAPASAPAAPAGAPLGVAPTLPQTAPEASSGETAFLTEAPNIPGFSHGAAEQ